MKLMKRICSIVLAVTMLAGCGTASTAKTTASASASASASAIPAEVTITDHADRTVTVPTDPKKVAILDIYPLPSLLTVYLNSADSIVAMEPVSMNAAKAGILSQLYPDILNVNTDIMNGDDVNMEALAALQPDVVFYNAAKKDEAQQLEDAGLTAVGISATKFNYDAIKTYQEWMSLLDQIYPDYAGKRGTQAGDYASQVYNDVQDKVKDVTDKQKVLFLYQYDDTAMVTSSSKFFGQWWCDAVGAANVAQDVPADNMNAKITMEQVYEWNPDVIIITNFTKTTPDDLYNNAIGSDDWSSVKAVQDKRVYKMPLGVYRTYTPGIDTPLTLEWLAQAVYPDLFSDVDVASDVKDYYNKLFGVTLTDDQISAMYTPNRDAGNWN
ncbi:MAG: ABC transporter substrate-binding protein [Erysipelotrichaceae bacterium]|jgi:iron complex transport system substrate-binding protein|nr:ABC transporter substrate-binding protein [Erysipelotrichaceae bacterium]MCI1326259.1 ABC transporter substrate-binding protein [Solobacterium sp.]MCH4045370.1 ABC transporter substrate-binding protein [Erysipelotrichaceae bacterium]MCH4122580.1 ABC transporter substrate-binding protein [Erysipelotrichaceae bacterium]MCI1362843.1 ABC transporter substrate-binding protein [Solobacterium sp.]